MMAGRMRLSGWALAVAGIIMVITAGLHGMGYRPLVLQLSSSTLAEAWLDGVKGLWLVFSLHLVIVGALFLMAALKPGAVGKGVLIVAGLLPAGDTVVLLSSVGVFIGSICLGLVAVLVYLGVALRPDAAASDGSGK